MKASQKAKAQLEYKINFDKSVIECLPIYSAYRREIEQRLAANQDIWNKYYAS